MSRALASAVVVAVLAAVAPAAAPLAPETLTLRLPDLGPGYERIDLPTSPCDLSLRDASRGCGVSFQQLWTVPGGPPGPTHVTSAAFTFPTPERAHAALARPRVVAASLFMSSAPDLALVEPAPVVGDEAALLRTAGAERSVSVWRSGSVVGVVFVSARYSGDAGPTQAVRLAGVQQARITTPTPLLPADFDDLEVLLDNPRLDVPVYWLGRSLPARGRLPALRLLTVTPAENADVRKGIRLDMTYGGSRGEATVTVGLQRPRPLADRRDVRQMTHLPCAESERVPLRNGHATLVRPERGCKGWYLPLPGFAFVRLPDATVFVALGAAEETCSRCYGPVIRYSLRTGMRRLVHALHLRERRDLTAPAG